MPAIAAPARSSSTASRSAPAWSRSARSKGTRVVTIEGLAAAEPMAARLQAAFLATARPNAASARPACWSPRRALLERNPEPDEADVDGRPRRRALPLHRLSQDHRGRERDCRATLRLQLPPGAGAAVGAPHRAARRRSQGRRRAKSSAPTSARPTCCSCAPSARPHHRARFALRRPRRLRRRASRRRRASSRRRTCPGATCYGVIPPFADQPVFAEARGALSRRGGRGRRRRACRRSRRSTSRAFPVAWETLPALTTLDAALRRDAPPRPAGRRATSWSAAASCAAMSTAALARGRRRRRGRLRDRLRRACLHRAGGRLRPPRRRPHRGPGLHPVALHGPRRRRRRSSASRRRRCASCRPRSAAASAPSSTSRCSPSSPSPPGISSGRCAWSIRGRNRW